MQVIYEDDDLLAVSKPPFLVTAPKHRWQVRGALLCQLCDSCFESVCSKSSCMIGLTVSTACSGWKSGQQSPQLPW